MKIVNIIKTLVSIKRVITVFGTGQITSLEHDYIYEHYDLLCKPHTEGCMQQFILLGVTIEVM